MTPQHKGKVAILVADGFEQVELEVPRKALRDAGFAPEIISPASGTTVRGFHHTDKGDEFPIDVGLVRARPEDYCALLLPGGVVNPDTLRQDPRALDFVRHFFEAGKPVAAICHGPWTLIDAGVASGRRLTSWGSIRTDLLNSGAEWVDEEVVCDRGLITSRSPKDLPAFCKKMLEAFQLDPQTREAAHRADQIAKIGELIKDVRIAMLTTHEPDGSMRSRPMATQMKKFDGTLWFFTAIHSGKSAELAEDQHVNVSYAEPKINRYISVSGRGRVLPVSRDRKRAEELWTPFVKAWFPKGLDDPELGLLRIEVERAEYWDAPAGKVVVLAGLAKSLLTGRPWQGEGTQHATIELEASRAEPATGASRSSGATSSPAAATPASSEPRATAAATDAGGGGSDIGHGRSAPAEGSDGADSGNGHRTAPSNGNGNGSRDKEHKPRAAREPAASEGASEPSGNGSARNKKTPASGSRASRRA
jgi:protease I